MKLSAETIYRIGRISRNLQVSNMYRGITLTLDVLKLTDSALLYSAFMIVSNYNQAPARELLVFAAAMVMHHRAAQARFTTAIRRSA